MQKKGSEIISFMYFNHQINAMLLHGGLDMKDDCTKDKEKEVIHLIKGVNFKCQGHNCRIFRLLLLDF